MRIAALQKLQHVLEDIFEESDMFPAEVTTEDLASSKYFDGLSGEGSQPLLSAKVIDKVLRYVTGVQGSKRKQKAAEEGATWNEEAIKKLFYLLERVIMEVEMTVVFPDDKKASSVGEKGKKGGRKAKGQKDTKSQSHEEVGAQELGDKDGQIGENEMQAHEMALARMYKAALAAECCLTALSSEGLSKPVSAAKPGSIADYAQLYSEDLLSTCVGMLKDELAKVVFPVMEGLAGESTCPAGEQPAQALTDDLRSLFPLPCSHR
jgi:cohesin loading factor subunit SCC2